MPDTHPEDLIRQLRSLAEDFADVHHLTLCAGLLNDDAILMPLIARIRTTQTLTNQTITLTLAAGDSITATTAGWHAIEHLTGAARHGNNAGGHLLKGIPAATALHRAPRAHCVRRAPRPTTSRCAGTPPPPPASPATSPTHTTRRSPVSRLPLPRSAPPSTTPSRL
ncbi:hypothetical protein [Streptomyces niveus]|uniref:hypothetical protein n=1 Tax=Streptomyces niveus TaxID=193462 RepID=UPI003431EFE3